MGWKLSLLWELQSRSIDYMPAKGAGAGETKATQAHDRADKARDKTLIGFRSQQILL